MEQGRRASTPASSGSMSCSTSGPRWWTRRTRVAAPPLRGEIEFRDVSFAYQSLSATTPRGGAGWRCSRVSFRIAAGEVRGARGAQRRGQEHDRPAAPAALRPARRRSARSTATTSGSSPSSPSGRRSAWCCRRRSCSAAPSPRTSPTAARGPRSRTSSPPPSRRRPRLRHGPARRLRHRPGRACRDAVRGPATASGRRPGVHPGRAHPRSWTSRRPAWTPILGAG